MKLDDLRNLDLDVNNIGTWPAPVKIILIILVCMALMVVAYIYNTKPQLEALEAAQQKEKELINTFEIKQAKAAKLVQYQEQIKEIERSFGVLLRQLPSKTEVADLLVEVSTAGITSGLEFALFQPEPEVAREFYAESPIKIRINGSYHEFGSFVSRVADLPRIVTLHDFVITSKSGEGKAMDLVMDTTAKTYRYLDEDEVAAQKSAAKPKGRER